MKVYTVMGTTGEYSDRGEWPVVSYLNEEKAKEHILRASEKAREWEIKVNGDDDLYFFDDIPEEYKEYDPSVQMDYTGTTYYYLTTELEIVEEMCQALLLVQSTIHLSNVSSDDDEAWCEWINAQDTAAKAVETVLNKIKGEI